jgi:hypothetical protein
MRKAVRLRVTLWLRGEDAPAHDFPATAIAAAREIVEAGAARHPELQLSIERIVEDDDYDGDEDEIS